jgi:hypothetical protein
MMLSKEAIARIGNFLLTGKPFGFAKDMDESWEEDTEPVEEEVQPDYGTLSQEDFIRGEMILGLMGYDIGNMPDEDKIKVLTEKPDYLRLVPKFDVSGQWVHVLRQETVDELEPTINSMVGKNQEICVTDANLPEFWNFSTGRRFGLVFEGRCKVLWNADMYSVTNAEGKLEAVNTFKQHLDKLTEGWVNLSEVTLVGLRVKEEESLYDDSPTLLALVDKLGITWNEGGTIEKQLMGIDVIDFEEAQAYVDIPVDFESPEHLFEGEEELGHTYQEIYDDDLIQASMDGYTEGVKALLVSGANPSADYSAALRQAAQDGLVDIVKILIEAGADITAEGYHGADKYNILMWPIVNDELETVRVLLDAGADVHFDYEAPLGSAVKTNDPEMVKLLLKYGADASAENSQYLVWAGDQDNLEIAKILIAAGADVNVLTGTKLFKTLMKSKGKK